MQTKWLQERLQRYIKKDISGSDTFILRLWMKNISWRLGDYTVSLEDSVSVQGKRSKLLTTKGIK